MTFDVNDPKVLRGDPKGTPLRFFRALFWLGPKVGTHGLPDFTQDLRFRRRPSRRYSRRPLRRTFKRLDLLVVDVSLDHRELQGRTTLDLLSYLPGLSGSHGKVFSFFGYLSVANTSGVPARVSLARAWVLSLRLSLATGCCPRRQGHLQDHLALPLKTSPWSSTPTGTAIVALNKPLAFLSQRLTSLGLFQ